MSSRRSMRNRGFQRDVVYLGRPIAPSYGGGGCGASANEYSCAHGAQINFGDLTPNLYIYFCGLARVCWSLLCLCLVFLRDVSLIFFQYDIQVLTNMVYNH
jgi:hypothetical protein